MSLRALSVSAMWSTNNAHARRLSSGISNLNFTIQYCTYNTVSCPYCSYKATGGSRVVHVNKITQYTTINAPARLALTRGCDGRGVPLYPALRYTLVLTVYCVLYTSRRVRYAAAQTPARLVPPARVRTSEEVQLLLGVALLPLPLRVEGGLAHAEEPRELVVVQVELLAGGVDPARPPLVSEL